MGKQDKSPEADGKFRWRGKNNESVTFEFVNSGDKDTHIVEQLTDDDITAKIPSAQQKAPSGSSINWFTGFSVYRKSNGQKSGYADVNYDVTLAFDSAKQYWVYDGQLRQPTNAELNSGKVRFNKGDPAVGSVP